MKTCYNWISFFFQRNRYKILNELFHFQRFHLNFMRKIIGNCRNFTGFILSNCFKSFIKIFQYMLKNWIFKPISPYNPIIYNVLKFLFLTNLARKIFPLMKFFSENFLFHCCSNFVSFGANFRNFTKISMLFSIINICPAP